MTWTILTIGLLGLLAVYTINRINRLEERVSQLRKQLENSGGRLSGV